VLPPQLAGVVAEITAVNEEVGCVMDIVPDPIHEDASVVLMVYTPALSAV
jgi:hypothetical protein